jgi:hypothetical protein
MNIYCQKYYQKLLIPTTKFILTYKKKKEKTKTNITDTRSNRVIIKYTIQDISQRGWGRITKKNTSKTTTAIREVRIGE